MTETGRASETTGRFQSDWQMAREMEVGARPGEYVPWKAIVIRPEILPREARTPDTETVERYAAAFWELPPIVVQRDTFVLLDGQHRLFASEEAGSMAVLIVEEDIADADLEDRAFELNGAHGKPLSTSERIRAMKRMLARHPHENRGDWSDAGISKWAGVNRETVAKYRRQLEGIEKARDTRANGQTAGNQQLPGNNGQAATRPTSIATHSQGPAVRGNSAPKPPPPPPGRVRSAGIPPWMEVLSEIMERVPRAVAEDVPEEEIGTQIREAQRVARWWAEFAEALESRTAVLT